MPRTARSILCFAASAVCLVASAQPLAAQFGAEGREQRSYYAAGRPSPPPAHAAQQHLVQTDRRAMRVASQDGPPQGAMPASTPLAVDSTTAPGVESTPLPPPSRRTPAGRNRNASGGGKNALTTVVSSLAIVLGLFFVVAWITRRSLPKTAAALPGEVVEVLGRAPLSGRQQMHLLRLGNKLVLVTVTPGGVETLAEITDPVEVDRISGLCRRGRSDSVSATFRQVFDQMGAERAPPGFLGGSERRT